MHIYYIILLEIEVILDNVGLCGLVNGSRDFEGT